VALIRVTLDLAFEADAAGKTKNAAAQAPLDALLSAVAAARPFAVWATKDEDTTAAAKHVCEHDAGGPCTSPVEIGARPVKRIAVAVAEIKPVEGEVGK
jgi:hypothetical protein